MSKTKLALALLLGIFTPLVPAIDPHLLLPLALFFCLLLQGSQPLVQASKWSWPFAWILGVWCAAQIATPGNLSALRTFFDGHSWLQGSLTLLHWLNQEPPGYFLSMQTVLRWLLLVWLFGILQSSPQLFNAMRNGLGAGLGLALFVCLLQVLDWLPIELPNQGAYWNSLGRYAATFSDPNAFGLFIVIAMPLFFGELRNNRSQWKTGALACALVLVAVLASYSGSRSLILGLLIYAIFALYNYSRRALVYALIFIILTIAFVNYAQFAGKHEFFQLVMQLPSSLQRSIASISWIESDQAFFSRWAFNRIGFAIWNDNWLIGAGLSQFRNSVPLYASELSVPIGLWTDNANNFYLGLLAELGLCGFLVFFLGLSKLKISESAAQDSLWALFCLMFLLFLGPHLDFNEVTVVVAMHMANALKPREHVRYGWGLNLCLFVVSVLVFLHQYYAEVGWYNWEGSSSDGYRRWSGAYARSVLQCNAEGKATFNFSVRHPDLLLAPVQVSVKAAFNPERMQTISQIDNFNWEFDCFAPSAFPGKKLQLDNLPFELKVSRLWIPHYLIDSVDARPLGINQYSEKLKKPILSANWLTLREP